MTPPIIQTQALTFGDRAAFRIGTLGSEALGLTILLVLVGLALPVLLTVVLA